MSKVLYNKSQKSFIVETSSVIHRHKGEVEEIVDVYNNSSTRIGPEAIVELTDEKADKLLSMYKKELVVWGKLDVPKEEENPEPKKKKKG